MANPDKLDRHLARWQAAKEARLPWTRMARVDLRILSGKAWEPEEIETFRAQGRDVPNYNLVAPMINLVAGVESQNRTDYRYLPRGPQDVDGSAAVTKIAKFIQDQTDGDRQLSRQFWDAITTGVGWAELAYNPDPYGPQIIQRRVNQFDVWGDPHGREPDLSDYLDVFRSVVTYPEMLAKRWPRYRQDILSAASEFAGDPYNLSHSADWTNAHGDRPPMDLWDDPHLGTWSWDALQAGERPAQIRAVERWYKVEDWAKVVRLRDGSAIEVTPANAKEMAQVLLAHDGTGRPYGRLIHAVLPRIRVAVFLPDLPGGVLLADSESPYPHNRFPFIPMWAYEDDCGRPAGIVRQLWTSQRDFNARMASLLKRSLTGQLLFEEGAFVDEDEALAEFDKSNGRIRLAPGGLQKIMIRDNVQGAPIEEMILGMDRAMIQDYSGATAEQQGIQTGAKSGIAMQTQIVQGQTRLYTIFDNRNWTQEQLGRLMLPMIRETFTGEMAVRVTESNAGIDFVEINQLTDKGIRNDITTGEYDCKVSLTSMRDTQAVMALESITNLASQMAPDLQALFAPQIARLAAMATNLPESQQLIEDLELIKQAMMQRLTGGGQPDPQAVQLQQQAVQLEMAGQEAEVSKTQAEAEAKKAEAMLKVHQATAPPITPGF